MIKLEAKMTSRKRVLIQRAQFFIARHHQNLDYETKVLYEQVRTAVGDLTDEEIAQAILRQMIQSSK